MENIEELNVKILKVTLLIQEDYPELSKFITEMPVTIPNSAHPNINLKNLKEYYFSLDSLLKKYIENKKLTNL